MYSTPKGMLPVTAAGLGGIATTGNMIWLGIALFVIGGTLITGAKFFPRIAIEPVANTAGHHRLRLTLNGRPVGGHHRN